jgi:hypothetical protein
MMLPVPVALMDTIPKTNAGKHSKIAIRKNLEEFVAKLKRVRLA